MVGCVVGIVPRRKRQWGVGLGVLIVLYTAAVEDPTAIRAACSQTHL
jgi:hypothetical protein